MSDEIKLLASEVDEFILYGDELCTFITLEKIAREIEELDITEIHLKKIEAYQKLKNWWKKIDYKYALQYSSEFQYEVDVVNISIFKSKIDIRS